jgi:hypothetical protein
MVEGYLDFLIDTPLCEEEEGECTMPPSMGNEHGVFIEL